MIQAENLTRLMAFDYYFEVKDGFMELILSTIFCLANLAHAGDHAPQKLYDASELAFMAERNAVANDLGTGALKGLLDSRNRLTAEKVLGRDAVKCIDDDFYRPVRDVVLPTYAHAIHACSEFIKKSLNDIRAAYPNSIIINQYIYPNIMSTLATGNINNDGNYIFCFVRPRGRGSISFESAKLDANAPLHKRRAVDCEYNW